MKYRRWLILTLTLFSVSILAILGCSDDPDHDNPVESAHRAIIRIEVVNGENEAIPNAMVRIDELNTMCCTNENGLVEVDVPFGMIHYQINKEQYLAVSDSVFVETINNNNVTKTLSGIPLIDSLVVLSGYEQHYDYNNVTYDIYEVKAFISDPDGIDDIDSLYYYDCISNEKRVLNLNEVENGVISDIHRFEYTNINRDSLFIRLNKLTTVTIIDNDGNSTSKTASLNSTYTYLSLESNILTGGVTPVNPTLKVLSPEVDFSPQRFRLILQYQSSPDLPDILNKTIIMNQPASSYDTLTCETNVEIEGTRAIDFNVTLYTPDGNWMTSTRQIQPGDQ